ncbi:MAG TPA: isochorismate synthase [Mycobacteriales bacterium]|nr:isochorismate synthase [Mycobacteriales bacterium]
MSSVPLVPPAVVRTVALPDPGPLALDLARLPRDGALAWLHRGEGLLGWGEVARLEISGRDRFARAAAWWESVCAALDRQPSDVPGAGPVAFGSFGFDPDAVSVLVVPQVVLGRRDGRAWLTTIGDGSPAVPTQPIVAPAEVAWSDGAVSAAAYTAAVAEAVRLIRAGEAQKIVLARDLVARADAPIDPRYLLSRLSGAFPNTWTFAVDGLVGATPEMLLQREGDTVRSRVLAGTAWRRPDHAGEAEVAAGLLVSGKDREEHAYAARSAAEALGPYCAELDVPAEPSVLGLSNVSHLCTDLVGRLAAPVSALELAGALHPTAAVCGTPTRTAGELIRRIEGLDRGRYAGPVGYVDANGDGEWGIALRCAQLGGATARLFAGCGIVADSDPETELAEAHAKFVAVRDALEP